MKKVILSLLLITSSVVAIPVSTVPVKKSRIRRAYHHTHDKLSKHKCKTCFVAGAIGATILTKAFSYEIDTYIKPLIKSVCKKTYNFFKRLFKGSESAGV